MFFVTILIKSTACRITPIYIYRLEAGGGGAGGGGAGGGGAGGGGPWTMVRGPWSVDHGPWSVVNLVAVELVAVELVAVELVAVAVELAAVELEDHIYQQLTKSDFYSIFGTKNWGFGATLKSL